MLGNSNDLLAAPGPLSAGNEDFTDTWHASN
jgi:hypothetical protein